MINYNYMIEFCLYLAKKTKREIKARKKAADNDAVQGVRSRIVQKDQSINQLQANA